MKTSDLIHKLTCLIRDQDLEDLDVVIKDKNSYIFLNNPDISVQDLKQVFPDQDDDKSIIIDVSDIYVEE